MNKWQRIGGYVILAYAVGFVYQSLTISLGPPGEPGPGFLGFILGLAMICSAVALIFANRGPGPGEDASGRSSLWEAGSWIKPLGAVAALAGFTALISILGTIITSVLFFLFWVKILERKSWLMAGLVAVLGTGTFYLLFSILLRVQLPQGFLAG